MSERPLPAYAGDEPYVFVSYSHDDDSLVLPEIMWLQAQGIRIWWDEGITPGAASWRTELASAIRGSAVLLFFVTPRSVRSEHCVREVGVALDDYQRPVVAVHLEPTKLPDSLVLALSGRQAIFRHELTGTAYAEKLASALEAQLQHGRRFTPGRSTANAGWPKVFAGLVLGALLGAAPFVFLPSPEVEPTLAGGTTRSYVDLDPDFPLTIGSDSHSWASIAVSRDGRHLAYVGKDAAGERHVLLSNLAEPGFRRVEGSEGALSPFFSPDGDWIAFFTDSKVRKVPMAGGRAVTIDNARTPIYAEWVGGEDVFVGNFEPDRAVPEHFAWSYTSDVLPDGATLLRTDRGRSSAAVNQAGIGLMARTGGDIRSLLSPGFGARYVPGGFAFYALRGELHAVRIDLDRGTAGRPQRMYENVAMDGLMGQVHAAASDTGLLAFAQGGDLSIGQPVWMDRSGRIEPLALPPAQYNVFHLSPGDEFLAIQVCDFDDQVEILSLVDGSRHRLGLAAAGWPVWARDGRSLYVSSREGDSGVLIRSRPSTDTFEVRLRTTGSAPAFFTDVHPVGGALLELGPASGVYRLAHSAQQPESIIGDGAWGGQFSPDAALVAYVSYDTGTSRVRVRGFPDGTFDIPVSMPEAVEPVWCRTCDELFFHDADTVYSVRVTAGPDGLTATLPEPVWRVSDWVDTYGRSYDISEDGQRLLYIRRQQAPVRTRIQLVHNWFDQLDHLPAVE